MEHIYICFPEGNYKAVTCSYDDGKIQDRRLVEIFNRYGIRGTFHLNSEVLKDSSGHRTPCILPEEVASLYAGHEVACHTCTHPTMTRTPMSRNLQEILEDRRQLEHLCGYPVRGMSYPNGTYNGDVKEAVRLCGIAYARITGDSERFDLPADLYAWQATCHHNHRLLELTEGFLNRDRDQVLSLFYVWGHSYEFDRDDNWDLIEKFAERIGKRSEIWYASNIEIVDYLEAAKGLRFFADGSAVYNPSIQPVWLRVGGAVRKIPGGEQVRLT